MNYKILRFIPIFLIFAISFTACEEDDNGTNGDSITLNADAGTDITDATVGEKVTLDGTGSESSNGSDFNYMWAFVSTPNGSNASLTGANTANPEFTPDVEGTYLIELIITSGDASDSDQVSVIATGGGSSGTKEITENVDQSTTWSDQVSDENTPDYMVMNSIDVNAELTIEAGVLIHFKEDAVLKITENGVLMAEGTAQNMITFTSANEAGNVHWGGIKIHSSDNRNAIIYSEVKYAGSKELDFEDFVDVKASIGLRGGGALKLKNSMISNSGGYGVYVRNGTLVEFEANEFNDNEGTGIGLNMEQNAMIDANTTFSGNVHAVEIFGSTLDNDSENTWVKLSGDSRYYVSGDLKANSYLSIDAGAKFDFAENKHFKVLSEGALVAKGTASDHIVFTSAKANSGIYWKGIGFESSDTRNKFQYVEVSYAGNSNWDFADFVDLKANIALTAGGKVTITNSMINNSNGYGFYVRYGEIVNFSSNTFNNNNMMAIGLNADQASSIDSETSFSENGWNGVEIYNSDVTEEATWVNLNGDAKYGVTGKLDIKAGLNIDPGAWLEMDEDIKIRIIESGYLNAQGTASDSITFTSSNVSGGIKWAGILYETPNLNNKLAFVKVLHAGGAEFDLDNFEDIKANIAGDTEGVLLLENSRVGFSDSYGVYFQGAGTINDIELPTVGNYFHNNPDGNVFTP
ncbi:MAG: right-handed parallel beta-helix repeat-containing protein [Bacteroidales bacterium]|nr:right-handed parallel beta-helix repeat-containing protein [Bacteroidales bacterium]